MLYIDCCTAAVAVAGVAATTLLFLDTNEFSNYSLFLNISVCHFSVSFFISSLLSK